MPPEKQYEGFSGKKKKEQLKAKRQRKRENEERQKEKEKAYQAALEEAVRDGVDLEEFEAEYYSKVASEARSPQKQKKRHNNNNKKGKTPHPNDDSSASDGGEESDGGTTRDKKEYVYGEDRKGVRSAFLKESDLLVQRRKKLSYESLPFRYFMNQNGIPFGSWFTAPGYGNMERVSRSTNNSFRDPAATSDDGKASTPCPAASASSLSSKHTVLGAASPFFPFSIELPSRGWKTSSSENDPTTSDTIQVVSNDTIFELETISEEDISSDATENKEGEDALPNTLSLNEKIKAIEEARFKRYLDYLEHFPIEKYAALGEGGNSPTTTGEEAANNNNNGSSLPNESFPNAVPLNPLDPRLTINSYERNLEVWRQLWRAVELSDVVFLVADSRFPIVHLPLALLRYITIEERKPLIVVMNKADLVPAFVVNNWIGFLRRFLKLYGLNIMSREEEETYLSEGGTLPNTTSTAAPIVIRTFTADPFSLGAMEEKNGQLNVQKRRRKNEKRKAKLYESLRSGKWNGNNTAITESGGEPNPYYRANFKGMKKASQHLHSGQEERQVMETISRSIDELLKLSKQLARLFYGERKVFTEGVVASEETAANKGVEGEKEREEEKEEVSSSVSDDADTPYADSLPPSQRSTPIIAPRHKRDKGANKKRHKKKGKFRQYDQDSDSGSDVSSLHLSASGEDAIQGEDSEEEVLDEREEDNAAYVHIAFVGFPNVGKSSLLNCIRGTKVVSVSQTAGHTKHVQTIPMPADGVTLVDSPGLAFPLLGLPPPLQAVIGTHQIAQVRDPMSGVAYLASHLPLEQMYHLKPVDGDSKDSGGKYPWSSYELCESFAKKKGFFVKNGKGALDVHRAAIAILKEAYEGRLVLYFSPPERNHLESRQFIAATKDKLFLKVFQES